jgi:peroxiredoxin
MQALALNFTLLSDWNGEAVRGFDLSVQPLEMDDVPARSAFLIEDGTTIRETWMLGRELPDIDAVVAAAQR